MTGTADFFERANQRHYEAVARGEHDEQCEWRPNNYVCHCEKRRRIASGLTEPPVLWFEYPTCGNCCQSVNSGDDGAWDCPRCHVSWGMNDYEQQGTFTDDYGDLSDLSAGPPPEGDRP